MAYDIRRGENFKDSNLENNIVMKIKAIALLSLSIIISKDANKQNYSRILFIVRKYKEITVNLNFAICSFLKFGDLSLNSIFLSNKNYCFQIYLFNQQMVNCLTYQRT